MGRVGVQRYEAYASPAQLDSASAPNWEGALVHAFLAVLGFVAASLGVALVDVLGGRRGRTETGGAVAAISSAR